MRGFGGYLFLAGILLFIVAGCRSSKHVPQGSYLLDKVEIVSLDTTGKVNPADYRNYLRQLPNHKILWAMKFQLGIYNISGRDSSKWYNKWMRKMGEPPVIYDSTLTMQSVGQLRRSLVSKGYLHADVTVDTIVNPRRDKIKVRYGLVPGPLYNISAIDYSFSNDTIRDIVMADSASFPVYLGVPLDRDMLETWRTQIAGRLRDKGYYGFNKEFITFSADTSANSRDVALTLKLNPPYPPQNGAPAFDSHSPYRVRKVVFVTDFDAVNPTPDALRDTVDYKDIQIIYSDSRYLRPSILWDNCFIRRGELYSDRDLDRTYEALNRLSILKFINIKTQLAGGEEWVDVYVLLTPGKSQTISFEIEGTNSEGDLGVAASVGYSHRNVGKGSETLTARFRGAYESLSGNLDGLLHDRYMEYSLDLGVSFPKFKAPFLRESFKRKVRASAELNFSMNYQQRPEYTRVIANAGWGYKWVPNGGRERHTFTLMDIDYVYLPESTNDFIDQIAPDNPLLRYSYEDHFIMRLGYSYYYTNKRLPAPGFRMPQDNIYTLRVQAETAGNLLYGLNNIFNRRANASEDPYRIFGIRYSQYVKLVGDFSMVHVFDHRNSLAFHAGIGFAYPYGNSNILPFEKRFYGGGANGVRGWDVRTLGPGSYSGSNSVSDFINQCGDIRFEASAEYRAKLFWVLEGALFIDAGNIWTIHNYPNQPGGMFHFNSFYKQIALAYGLGIRLDFTYFLVRLDLGMKAHNPAKGAERWPLLHPRWGRDSSFHFSIGYPF